MNWFIAVAGYVVIWWTVIFAILPIGVKRSDDVEKGNDVGAPANPQLGRKVVITSVVAALVWLLAYAVVNSGFFDFRIAS